MEDVKNWNKWNVGIEYSYLNGKFENGTNGSLKTSLGKESLFCFELLNCEINKSFITRIKLIFCIMDIEYEIIENNDKIKYFIRMNGLLTSYYKKILE